jgi:hypothetical protein
MTHRDVTLEKIEYMMNRMGGDDELTVDDLESMIVKVFVSSFEYERGFEASLIRALVDARHDLLCSENEEDEDPVTLDSDAAEKWYVQCQTEMYKQNGCDAGYAEESASWPDSLPLIASWDAAFLKSLARKEVAHHFVVMDQLRAEMEKHKETEEKK